MDSSLKTFVDFKPGKKMRTRRELNKLSNKFIKRNGQKALLTDDSESSDDDFVSKKAAVQRPGRLCKVFVLCMVIALISSCIVSVGGLAWFYFDLKRQCEALEVQLKLLSTTQTSNGDCTTIVTKQSLLEAQVQMLHSDLNTLRSSTTTLQQFAEQSLLHVKSMNVSVHQLSSLPLLVQTASNKLSILEADLVGLHNATNHLGQQVRRTADANLNQSSAINKTLEKLYAEMLTILQEKEKEVWTKIENVTCEQQQQQLNQTSAELTELYARMHAMNSSIMQHVGKGLQGVYAQFTTVRQRIAQLEYSLEVRADCSFFADVKNCTAAEEVFARLDSDGDGSVSVGDVLDQSAANNCSARFLQYFAGADGAYDLSDFVRAVGLVDCPDLPSGRRRRSHSSQDIRWMMQSLNVEVP